MTSLASPTTFKKFVPAAKGTIQTSVTGIGFQTIASIVDGIFGAPVQRIFSLNVPLVGPVGPIDVLNYWVHAGGFKISKKGLTAVLAAKLAQTGSIAGFNLVNIGAQNIPATLLTQNQGGATTITSGGGGI